MSLKKERLDNHTLYKVPGWHTCDAGHIVVAATRTPPPTLLQGGEVVGVPLTATIDKGHTSGLLRAVGIVHRAARTGTGVPGQGANIYKGSYSVSGWNNSFEQCEIFVPDQNESERGKL